MTTRAEREILDDLARVWGGFLCLPDLHPDDREELRHSIHAIQCLVAWRVARRADPEVWGKELPEEDWKVSAGVVMPPDAGG